MTNEQKSKIVWKLADCVTVSGQRVINVQYKPYNSNGYPVTFPIKGTIILKERPLKMEFNVWTIDGKNSVFGNDRRDIKCGE